MTTFFGDLVRRLIALSALMAACTHPEAAPPAPPAGVSVTPLFCAHGGVGLVPDPLPPGMETQLATVVFDVERAGPPLAGVSVAELVLLDDAGTVTASMKRVVHLVELASAAPPPAPGASGSWAFYLNPSGKPFAGTLAPGKTRLRVRGALDRTPMDATRFRLKLGGAPSSSPKGESMASGRPERGCVLAPTLIDAHRRRHPSSPGPPGGSGISQTGGIFAGGMSAPRGGRVLADL